MNSFEIDPIIGDQTHEGVPLLEVTVESENIIRSRIKEILQPIGVTQHVVDEDGITTVYFTKSAEYVLPNGDRVEVKSTYDECSEDGGPFVRSGFDQYDVVHYQPVNYDDKGRLNIRKRSYDFTLDPGSPSDTINVHSDEFIELVPRGARSSFMEALAEVATSDFEIDADALREMIGSIESNMAFADDMNSVNPEKLGYMFALLCALKDEFRVLSGQISWSESAR